MSPSKGVEGEDALIVRPCNPRDPRSHPALTAGGEVEGRTPLIARPYDLRDPHGHLYAEPSVKQK